MWYAFSLISQRHHPDIFGTVSTVCQCSMVVSSLVWKFFSFCIKGVSVFWHFRINEYPDKWGSDNQGCTVVKVPSNCVNKLWSLDLSVNKVVKDSLKAEFTVYCSRNIITNQGPICPWTSGPTYCTSLSCKTIRCEMMYWISGKHAACSAQMWSLMVFACGHWGYCLSLIFVVSMLYCLTIKLNIID
jgi:hypothetical protein